jgi:hypothetical protein
MDTVRRARLCQLLADAALLCWDGVKGLEMVRHGLAEFGRPLPKSQAALAASTLAVFYRGLLVGGLPGRLRP